MDNPDTLRGPFTQESTSADSACTAYSAANLVGFMGYQVSNERLIALKNESMSEIPTGLKPPQINAFLNEFGLRYQYLGEKFTGLAYDKTEFLGAFVRQLRVAPISFSISSAMSLYRDPNSLEGVSHIGRPGIQHQVVARIHDNWINIVDPYVPNAGVNSHKTNDTNSMMHLLELLTSVGAQYYLQQERKPLTRDSVRHEASNRLNSPNSASFIKASMSGNNMYTATKI